MKHLYTSLAAAFAFATAFSAQAEETWQFDHVAFSGRESSAVTLLSQSATATVVSMTSMEYASTLFESSSLPSESMFGLIREEYEVNVADGYRVTGVTMEFDLQGAVRTAAPNGYAFSRLQPFFHAVNGGMNHGWYMLDVERLDGTYHDSATLSEFSSGNFTLDLNMRIETEAASAYTLGPDGFVYTDPSYANIWADNITITIHTAVIPEPAEYLMLGAGLALLGGLARKNRKTS